MYKAPLKERGFSILVMGIMRIEVWRMKKPESILVSVQYDSCIYRAFDSIVELMMGYLKLIEFCPPFDFNLWHNDLVCKFVGGELPTSIPSSGVETA